MSNNVCLLPLDLTSALAGYHTPGLPSFPFELSVLAPLWQWPLPWRGLRAAWPFCSLTVTCFLSLDSWGIVTALLNYLIRTYRGVEHSEWIFFWNVMYCGFSSSCVSDNAVFYHSTIWYFFHSIFGVLYIRDTNHSCVGFSLLWFHLFQLCAL